MSETKRLVIEKFGEMSPVKTTNTSVGWGGTPLVTTVHFASYRRRGKVFDIHIGLTVTQLVTCYQELVCEKILCTYNLKDHFTDPANPTEVELDEFYHEQGFYFFLDPRFFAEGV